MKYIIFTSVLLLFFYSNTFCQQEQNLPLSLKISVKKIDETKKTFLIKKKLINISEKKIVIDKNFVGSSIFFIRENGSRSSHADVGSDYKGKFIVLYPKQAYISTQIITIEDEFFNVNGEYKLSITYNQSSSDKYEKLVVWKGIIVSNDIIFEMSNGEIIKFNKSSRK